MDNGLTFSEMIVLAQKAAHDTTAEAKAFLIQQMNIGLSILTTDLGVRYNEDTRSINTIASTNSYNLPENFVRLKHLYVMVGTIRYTAQEVFDENYWQRLMIHASAIKSDFLTHVFIRRSTFEIYPYPANSSNVMSFIYEPIPKPLLNEDYTTGTITTLTNNAQVVTGSGTTWTSTMIGRHFKINADGQYYEIATVPSTTSLTIAKPYQGISIAAGTSAYTIGEMPRLPGPTNFIPPLYAAWKYYEMFKKSNEWATRYKMEYEQANLWAKEAFNRQFSDTYIPNTYYMRKLLPMRNVNWFPQNIGL